MTELTVWHLESRSKRDLKPASNPGTIQIREAGVKQYPFNRFLYELVGAQWQWTDKLCWSDQRWRDYAESADLRTWIAWQEGSPAGYFELQKQAGDEIEICYFGLAPAFIGQGIGGHLLSECIRAAWAWNPSRVLVNTCSLDHHSALSNYQARGMAIYRTEIRPA
jgi:ribosomal protein S18 acetylase RimI-like enzyme